MAGQSPDKNDVDAGGLPGPLVTAEPGPTPAAPPAVYADNHRWAVRNGTPAAAAADRTSGTPSNTCGPNTAIRPSRSVPTPHPQLRSTSPHNPTKLRHIIRPNPATYRDTRHRWAKTPDTTSMDATPRCSIRARQYYRHDGRLAHGPRSSGSMAIV